MIRSNSASLKSVIIAVASAQFLLPFMVTGVNPLLPSIGRDLNASAMEISLINAIYTLSLGVVYLVSGRISDIVGRKKIFLLGLAIFTCMSGVLPFAPKIEIFLAFRFIQAVGTAMMNTSALAILTVCAPHAMLGRVLAVSSIGLYVGMSIGPAISGVIATMSDWRYLFWGVVPIGVLTWCFMAFGIKGDDWTDAPDAPFDWSGASFYIIGICALSCGATWILKSPLAKGSLLLGFFLLILFIKTEWHRDHPILDIHFLIHNKTFALSSLAAFINYSSLFGVMFYFSLYLQAIHGLTIFETGLMLCIQTAIQIFVGPIGGRLSDKHGAEKIATVGIFLTGIGLLISALLNAGSSLYQVACAQLLLGTGVALFAAPNTSAIMGSVDKVHLGQASGLTGTVRTLGMLFSMVIVSISMNLFLGDDPLRPENTPAFLQAMHSNFILFGILNLLGIFCSVVRLRKPVPIQAQIQPKKKNKRKTKRKKR